VENDRPLLAIEDAALPAHGIDAVEHGQGPLPALADAAPPPRVGRAHVLFWTPTDCSKCGAVHIGEYKYDPAPGGRAPVWIMRIRLPDGTWPNQGRACFSTKRTSVVGETEEYALRWIAERRSCCAD
jgi:hypothetical protein